MSSFVCACVYDDDGCPPSPASAPSLCCSLDSRSRQVARDVRVTPPASGTVIFVLVSAGGLGGTRGSTWSEEALRRATWSERKGTARKDLPRTARSGDLATAPNCARRKKRANGTTLRISSRGVRSSSSSFGVSFCVLSRLAGRTEAATSPSCSTKGPAQRIRTAQARGRW